MSGFYLPIAAPRGKTFSYMKVFSARQVCRGTPKGLCLSMAAVKNGFSARYGLAKVFFFLLYMLVA